MTANEALLKYNRNRILSASQGELVLMLYDGCIKYCNMSKKYIAENNNEQANFYSKKAQAIINELINTLDMRYEVAHDYERVYRYILNKLVMSNVKKDPELIDDALSHIRDMRDIWVKILKTQNKSVG